ncbi:hypothetical protein H9P43_005415 [Blastocladiella emersonii ATCC 22665]|nr:hypothetical protein H9P43_005415 [Blastocladiella emersonii ATCC 22665]
MTLSAPRWDVHSLLAVKRALAADLPPSPPPSHPAQADSPLSTLLATRRELSIFGDDEPDVSIMSSATHSHRLDRAPSNLSIVPVEDYTGLQHQLSECRAELHAVHVENQRLQEQVRSAAASASAAPVPAPAVVQETRDEEDQDRECTQCLEYESYVTRLESESLGMRSRVAEQAHEIDDLRDLALHDAVLSLREELDRVTESRTSIAREHASLSAARDAAERDRDAWRARCGDLERIAEEGRQAIADRDVLTEQRRALLANFDARLQAVEDEERAERARLQRQLDALSPEFEGLRNALHVAQQDLSGASALVRELEAELTAEKTMGVHLQRENAALVDEVEQLKVELDAKQSDTAQLAALRAENTDLHHKLDRAQSQLRVLQATVDQVIHSPPTRAGSVYGGVTPSSSSSAAGTPKTASHRVSWAPSSSSGSAIPVPSSSSSSRPGSVTPETTSAASTPGSSNSSTGLRPPSIANMRALALHHSASQPNLRASVSGLRPPSATASGGMSPPSSSAGTGFRSPMVAWSAGRDSPVAAAAGTQTQPQGQQGGESPASSDARWRQHVETARQLEAGLRDLQARKESLQADYARIPLTPSSTNRRRKEELEGRLDAVDREIGSVRMKLKAMHFP